MPTTTVFYKGANLTVAYTVEDVDYGVAGSPSWLEVDITSVKIEGVELIETDFIDADDIDNIAMKITEA